MAHDAKNRYALPELGSKKDFCDRIATAVLETHTYRASNGQLFSAAHVSWVDDQGGMTTEIFGDFSKVYARTTQRGTQSNIDTQHAEVFTPSNIEILRGNIVLFYQAKAQREQRQVA